MSDEHDNNKTIYQAQSSETMGGSGSASPDMDYVRPAEIPEQDLYHGHSFITKWHRRSNSICPKDCRYNFECR